MTIPPQPGTHNEVVLCDGLMVLTWFDETVLVENARAVMTRISELSAGGIYPLLVELHGIQKVTYRAQKTFAAGPWPVSRVAIVAYSPVDRVAADFYLGRNPPACPARMFGSAKQAITWLLDPTGTSATRRRPQE